jgi:uncharacterized membrane protein
MSELSITRGRISAVSDGVLALILVLSPRVPHDATIGALLGLWPAAISYLFKAIVRVNNRYLAPLAALTIRRLDRGSFRYLLELSFLAPSTVWIAPANVGRRSNSLLHGRVHPRQCEISAALSRNGGPVAAL